MAKAYQVRQVIRAVERALSGIQRLVADCVADMRTNGEPVPEPMADRAYSGKFMVRVPPETHRALPFGQRSRE